METKASRAGAFVSKKEQKYSEDVQRIVKVAASALTSLEENSKGTAITVAFVVAALPELSIVAKIFRQGAAAPGLLQLDLSNSGLV